MAAKEIPITTSDIARRDAVLSSGSTPPLGSFRFKDFLELATVRVLLVDGP